MKMVVGDNTQLVPLQKFVWIAKLSGVPRAVLWPGKVIRMSDLRTNKVKQTKAQRIRWTENEIQEIQHYAGRYLDKRKTPSRALCRTFIQKSKDSGGELHKRSADLIVKKISAMNVKDSVAADEPKILCIVRDLVDPNATSIKHTMNLPATISVRGFTNEVCKQFGYMLRTIAVHYERQDGTEVSEVALENFADAFLEDIVVASQRRHNFTICELEGILPQKMAPPPPALPTAAQLPDSSSTSLDSSSYFSSNTTVEPRPSISSTASTSSSYTSEFSYASTLTKSDTGYVGLVNQAMTCYLNSLLQTLFMTPEFRNAIYRFHFDSDMGVKNIPYQLQRLFLLLQTSKKRAVETMDLTKSFGWDSSEVWQQHDVQELCRVMFDALEVTWRGTDQENLINQLYQGKMKDYVKCLECRYESAREDTFLDIPLVIRPFGSNTAYKSIEEALKAFVSPEILEGRDQYFCEKCNKKCDAHKGLKFMSFPYMLTLQMKRFDFDYNLMHRIKLNHRMTFPEILNLNHLVEDQVNEADSCGDKGSTVLTEDTSLDDSLINDNAIDEGIEVEGSGSNASGTDESSCSNEALVNDRNAQASDVKGPFVYELFSIMIHSGSAAGGHYYAYIKCLSDGQWYSFNDQHVTKITYDDIRKTYGGTTSSRGYYSSTYASSANAYMLMYRQIDKERNADFTLPEDFPQHVKEVLRRLNDKEEADRKQKELDKSTCKIKLFCNHPTLKKKMEHKLEIHKDKTLSDATEMALKIFELEKVIERDCCRIVKYDEYQDTLECSFDDDEDTPLEKLLGGVKQSYSFDLLLETKKPDQKFQQYKTGGVTVRVYVTDIEKDVIVEPPSSVRAYLTQTVAEFKELVSQVLNLPNKDMRCVLERFHNDLKVLETPEKTLKSEGFFKTNKVYIEVNATEEEMAVRWQQCKFFCLLDRHQNTIRVNVTLPSLSDVEEYKKGMFLREPSPTGQDSAVESGVNSADNSTDNSVDMCNHRLTSLDIDEGMTSDRADLLRDIKSLNLQSHLSRSDPSLYHNQSGDSVVTQGDVLNSLKSRGSRTSLECQDSHSCSQSTQSTSTSAEFSLSHINSICDGTSESPDEGLVSPGDKVSEPLMTPGDKGHDLCEEGLTGVGAGGEPGKHSLVDKSSEVDMSKTYTTGEISDVLKSDKGVFIPETENWDEPCSSVDKATASFVDKASSAGHDSSDDSSPSQHTDNAGRYFHADVEENEDTQQKSLIAYVDKRINLGAFKSELEPFVGVPAGNFKVYRVYTNNQEFESIRLNETLSFLEDGRINIKLGRALKSGEYRVKVFQLLVNDQEPSKFLIDTIFARGMTVLESKQQILPELKQQLGMDVPLDRCRLRKKTWKNPGTIYVENQVYEDEIPIYPNWEVFLEILQGPEVMISTAQLAIYVRRWWPSKYELGPFEEVVISDQTVEELKNKISGLSDINVDDIEIAKGRGTFPYDVSLLEIHSELDWNPAVSSLGMWPLYICDDGCLVYYRDRAEPLAEMDDDQKKELETKENARLSKVSQRVTYSPRKEKALKIYTEDPTPAPSNSTNISPDLD